MLTDQSAPHAPLNHILPLRRGKHRNAGTRQVPGKPPLQLMLHGRRVVLGLLRLGLGIAGTHVLGPATERVPPRMTSRSCDSMQHTLHLSHALAWFRMLRPVSLPRQLFTCCPTRVSSRFHFHAPSHPNTHLHFFDDTTSVSSCCLPLSPLRQSHSIGTCLHCQHLSALE